MIYAKSATVNSKLDAAQFTTKENQTTAHLAFIFDHDKATHDKNGKKDTFRTHAKFDLDAEDSHKLPDGRQLAEVVVMSKYRTKAEVEAERVKLDKLYWKKFITAFSQAKEGSKHILSHKDMSAYITGKTDGKRFLILSQTRDYLSFVPDEKVKERRLAGATTRYYSFDELPKEAQEKLQNKLPAAMKRAERQARAEIPSEDLIKSFENLISLYEKQLDDDSLNPATRLAVTTAWTDAKAQVMKLKNPKPPKGEKGEKGGK